MKNWIIFTLLVVVAVNIGLHAFITVFHLLIELKLPTYYVDWSPFVRLLYICYVVIFTAVIVGISKFHYFARNKKPLDQDD